MSLRAIFLILALALLALFTVINWSAVMAPTSLSLLFGNVEAPIGLIMLGAAAVLSALFLGFIVFIQTTVILDARRAAREITAQRELADQAEASRFTELRGLLETRLQAIGSQVTDAQARIATRIDGLDTDLRAAVQATENSLSASIGEFEDRMEKRLGDAATKQSDA